MLSIRTPIVVMLIRIIFIIIFGDFTTAAVGVLSLHNAISPRYVERLASGRRTTAAVNLLENAIHSVEINNASLAGDRTSGEEEPVGEALIVVGVVAWISGAELAGPEVHVTGQALDSLFHFLTFLAVSIPVRFPALRLRCLIHTQLNN